MQESIRYFVPTQGHGAALRAMAREAFSDTFAALYDAAPFARFLEETYGRNGRMQRDLADPGVRWMAAAHGADIIGYAKLSRLIAPAPAPKPGAMELLQSVSSAGSHLVTRDPKHRFTQRTCGCRAPLGSDPDRAIALTHRGNEHRSVPVSMTLSVKGSRDPEEPLRNWNNRPRKARWHQRPPV